MTVETGSLREVAEQVRQVEARLERLLASGWRNAGAEAADLAQEAATLGALGPASLAERLQHVAAAADGAAALPAIALALAACRQLRVRLAADSLSLGDWAPLAPPRRQAGQTQARLIPLARIAVGQEEVWACVRLRGQWADEYYLVDPPTPGQTVSVGQVSEVAADAVEMVPSDTRPDNVRQGDAYGGQTPEPAWMRCVLEGWLVWQARHPLGASGEVERCRLAGGKVVAPNETEAHLATALVQVVSKPKDGAMALGGAGGLRLRLLARAEANAYVWPDPVAAAAFASARDDKLWALTWGEDAAIKPLALLSPAGFFKQPALIHLVPGLPRTPFG